MAIELLLVSGHSEQGPRTGVWKGLQQKTQKKWIIGRRRRRGRRSVAAIVAE
jgi:hypothetical protein